MAGIDVGQLGALHQVTIGVQGEPASLALICGEEAKVRVFRIRDRDLGEEIVSGVVGEELLDDEGRESVLALDNFARGRACSNGGYSCSDDGKGSEDGDIDGGYGGCDGGHGSRDCRSGDADA